MSHLNPGQAELVALGAAMGSNCLPCVEYHVPEALEAGLTPAQVSEAIALADKVRQVPARKVLERALHLLREMQPEPGAPTDESCGSTPGAASAGDPPPSSHLRM